MDSQTELLDTDGDGLIDSEDADDDGDGWSDSDEAACGSNGYEQDSIPIDTDLDGVCDFMDSDNDGDGVLDYDDKFPYDSNESKDLDGDGVGNTRDLDDDGDGWSDENEVICQTNSLDISSIPIDSDGDGICDLLDPDLYGLLDKFRWIREWDNDEANPEWYGMNITTWQMENGGWRKNNFEGYTSTYDGVGFPNSHFANLATFANKATTGEIRYLSFQYSESENFTNKSAFRNAVERGIQFIIDAQHPSGGWPQVYPYVDCSPSNCEYHNYMTFNDYVIPSAILLLMDVNDRKTPFNSDIVENVNFTEIEMALENGIDFLIASQIVVNGTPTLWGQQHDPESLEPLAGRSWELPCRTPNESSFVVSILLNWPERTPEIYNATWGAVDWYVENAIEGVRFDQKNGTILESEGRLMWYRYYNVSDDQFFLVDYDSNKVYNLNDIPEEQRKTYSWAYKWGEGIVRETAKILESDRF
jgi:PelA/Pel-15E family pectate lyase